MNSQDFESQYRETLNELQSAILLLAQAQRKISIIGSSVQNLSQTLEEHLINQKSEHNPNQVIGESQLK
ncbi:MAG: hypothetical protein WBA39_02595 [Rivularia sp. (in: cyanobacteria)]